MQSATLLHASLDAVGTIRWLDDLAAGLPYAWRLRLESAGPEARRSSLAGIGLALGAAARLRGDPPALHTLRRDGADARPVFSGGPVFSVSHATTRVAAVVAGRGDVGLDVEAVDSRFGAERLRRWTATEAALKAAGLGLRSIGAVNLGADLAEAWIAGRRFLLVPVDLGPDIAAHVATDAPLDLQVAEVTLDSPELSAAVERSLGLATQR